MKKILALLLALMCTLSFVACDEDKADKGKDEKVEDKADKKKPAKEEKTDEELARETAEGFMDAFMELDPDGMSSYLDDPAAMEDDLKKFDKKAAMGEMPDEMSDFEEQYERIMTKVFKNASDAMSYKITDTKEDDGSFIFEVEAEVISGDMSAALSGEDIAMDLAESGEIKEGMSQDEVLTIYFDAVEEAAEDIEIETASSKMTIVVYEVDGEWLINVAESNL